MGYTHHIIFVVDTTGVGPKFVPTTWSAWTDLRDIEEPVPLASWEGFEGGWG